MSLHDYQIVFIDPSTGTQLDIVDARRIQRLQYNRIVNDTSRLTLTLMPNDRLQNRFGAVNLIMVVYRANNGFTFQYEDAFLSRYWGVSQPDNNVDYVTIGAEHLLDLFKARLIVPDDDPAAESGYSLKGGIADIVMYGYVTDQTISPAVSVGREIPNLTNAPSQNLGQQVIFREQYSSLLDVLQRATVLGLVDFRLVWTSGNNFQFQVDLVGRDLTVSSNYPFAPFLLFAPERRNMRKPEYTVNRYNEITVTYVATQGIEEDREVTPQNSPNLYLPLNRRENIIDQRQIEDDASFLEALTTAGSAELRDKQPQIEFTFDADVFSSGARYNTDWRLGDRVTAQYLGFSQNLRIKEVKIDITKVSENITPIFEVEVS